MAKIDTTKDFIKVTGSLVKAKQLVRSLIEEGESFDSRTGMYGNRIAYARGKQKNFDWSYNPHYKSLRVDYTDGREKPEEKEKKEYYVIWIEGIDPMNGEKILSLDGDSNEYTTKMTQAMRILPDDREAVREILRERGIAEWALQNCMVRTNYAPQGTLFKV